MEKLRLQYAEVKSMMKNDRIFLDTNVLVYLVDEDAQFHEKAMEIFSNIKENYDIWISRQVLREYAVVVSRTRDVSTPAEPFEIADDLEKWENAFFCC